MDDFTNIIWRSLDGTQRPLSAGTDTIRRFAPGFSPLIGFADAVNPDFAAIAPHCEPGEKFYCAEWSGPVPDGWTLHVDAFMCAMAYRGSMPAPDENLGAVRLMAEHVPQAMALTALTRPGPFGARTIELGEWYGVFEGTRLVAMAGERLQCEALREISGVCTHPDFQGRGWAKRLTHLVIRRQLERGHRPFLHVASANAGAIALYEKMGFAVEREVAMRVLSRQD